MVEFRKCFSNFMISITLFANREDPDAAFHLGVTVCQVSVYGYPE